MLGCDGMAGGNAVRGDWALQLGASPGSHSLAVDLGKTFNFSEPVMSKMGKSYLLRL